MDEAPLLGAVSHNGEEVASDAKRLAHTTGKAKKVER
jgi:hypothetical protein